MSADSNKQKQRDTFSSTYTDKNRRRRSSCADLKIRSGELVKRFTRSQVELAQQISNDIAEDINNGHSQAQLRMAIAYYADIASVETQKRIRAEFKIRLLKIARKMERDALK